jgi:transposase InsO family protein
MTVAHQFEQNAIATTGELLQWVSLPRSTYYYKASGKPKGILASTHTRLGEDEMIGNDQVVDQIAVILNREFVCYGYLKVTKELQHLGYHINHKKVYRLMKDNHLVYRRTIRTSGKRNFVKFRKIQADRPLQYLTMDIKYVYIHADRKHAYLLTLMDVYTRKVLAYTLRYSMRHPQVIALVRQLRDEYHVEGIILRNDNGSQFIANNLRAAMQQMGIDQEFTHIASPQENAFIESLHSQLQREVINRYIFDSIYEAELTIVRYYDFYNNHRLHGGIDYKTPEQVWKENIISIPYKTNQQKHSEPQENRLTNSLYSNDHFVQFIGG